MKKHRALYEGTFHFKLKGTFVKLVKANGTRAYNGTVFHISFPGHDEVLTMKCIISILDSYFLKISHNQTKMVTLAINNQRR